MKSIKYVLALSKKASRKDAIEKVSFSDIINRAC